MENRFNLVDEAWIPVSEAGKVSLRQIFSEPNYRSLSGNPVEKIALFKLLLAIAQAASTPSDEAERRMTDPDRLAERCLSYLDEWYDRFYIYGQRPFLQMPAIRTAKLKSFGTVQPEVATGNTTVLTQGQVERHLSDAEKALKLIVLMSFDLGSKKADNSVTLTRGYAKKSKTAKAGPAVGHSGFLHSFLLGSTLRQTLWLNLLTLDQIMRSERFPQGVGTAPWEQMPQGEDCPVAKHLKESVLGRLIPMARFCLLVDRGLHYSEGIAHPDYKEGVCDPTVSVNWSGKEPKALWVNPEKRPWRELTAMLSFNEQQRSQGFSCMQLDASFDRACGELDEFSIWSGGLRVRSNTGEQRASGSDDYVESELSLTSADLGEFWFAELQAEMSALDQLAKSLFGLVTAYYKSQSVQGAKLAAQATHLFWQLCERDFQDLLDSCGQNEQSALARGQLRRRFAAYSHQAFDQYCAKNTARQLDAWARCRPNHKKYLQ